MTKREWIVVAAAAALLGLFALVAWWTERADTRVNQIDGALKLVIPQTEDALEELKAATAVSRESDLRATETAAAERAHREAIERELVHLRQELAAVRAEKQDLVDEFHARPPIHTQSDRELADRATRTLQLAFSPREAAIHPSGPARFEFDRDAVELTLMAGEELLFSRDMMRRQNQEIHHLEAINSDVDAKVASLVKELATERTAKWDSQSETRAAIIALGKMGVERDLYREQAGALKSSKKWGGVKKLLITGGLVTAGVMFGGKEGLAFAGGAGGAFLIERIF